MSETGDDKNNMKECEELRFTVSKRSRILCRETCESIEIPTYGDVVHYKSLALLVGYEEPSKMLSVDAVLFGPKLVEGVEDIDSECWVSDEEEDTHHKNGKDETIPIETVPIGTVDTKPIPTSCGSCDTAIE